MTNPKVMGWWSLVSVDQLWLNNLFAVIVVNCVVIYIWEVGYSLFLSCSFSIAPQVIVVNLLLPRDSSMAL